MPTPRPLSSPAARPSVLVRLTAASALAAIRPPQPIEVSDPNRLSTARLEIRPLVFADHDAFMRTIALSRAHLDRHMPLHKDGESDGALFERLVELSRRGLELGRAWRAGFFARGEDGHEPGRLLGLINLNDLMRGLECRAEANWWTAADAVGHGFATEALRAVLAHAFDDLPRGLGLQRVTALIDPSNHASRRVAAKAGMHRAAVRTGLCPADRIDLVIAGKPTVHEVHQAFAALTAPPAASPRRPGLRAGLASILRTEAAAECYA